MATDVGINIRLIIKVKGEPFDTRFLDSRTFFDDDYLAKQDDPSPDCDTPWKYESLIQFVEEVLKIPGDRIELLELDIFHRLSGEHRRYLEQRWSGHSVRVDWKASPFCEPSCLLSLTVLGLASSASQFMKIKLWPLDFAILSHFYFLAGNSDAVEFVDGYERKRPL